MSWPRSYSPARPDKAGDGLVVDGSRTVEAYQLQPGSWRALAEWCDGTRVLDGDGNQAVAVGSLDPDAVAQLGDFVVRDTDGFRVERADGFHQRFVPTP